MSFFKFKRFFLILLPLMFSMMFWALGTFVSDEDIRINSYEATIDLNNQGDMKVIERWDMKYSGEYHVRFRDIVFRKYPKNYPLYQEDSNQASFDREHAFIKVFKDNIDITEDVRLGYSFKGDIDELGEPVACYENMGSCESLFVDFTPIGLLKGNIIFEYEYTILGAVTSYSDISELNWKMFNYMESEIEEINLTINLPNNSYWQSDLQFFFHGRNDFLASIISNEQVKLSLKNHQESDLFEFRLLTPKDIFNDIRLSNIIDHEKINKSELLKYEDNLVQFRANQDKIESYLLLGLIPLAAIVIVMITIVYFKHDREYKIDGISKMTRNLPSDHTPAEVGYLTYMGKIGEEEITATLLDLIRKEYITIDSFDQKMRSKDADFTLYKRNEKGEDGLKPHETRLLNWFFNVIGDKNQVTTKQIENYGNISLTHAKAFQNESTLFTKSVNDLALQQNFFENSKSKGRKIARRLSLIPLLYLLVSIILGINYDINFGLPFAVSIGLMLGYLLYVSLIKRRTYEGQELYLQWQAYKNYLLELQSIKDRPMPEIDTLEHILVYATTFKLADTVMEQLRVKITSSALDQTHSNQYDRFMTYTYLYTPIRHSYHSGTLNSIKTVSKYQSNASGGGSSGGGGGGGRSR